MNDQFGNGKIFSFCTEHFSSPCILDNICLYQMAENMIERGGEIYTHTQECHEISYIISGSADFYANGEKRTVHRGDVHIDSKDVDHRIVVNSSERLRYFCLGFDISSDVGDCYSEIASYFRNVKCEIFYDRGDVYVMVNQILKQLHTTRNTLNNEIFMLLIKVILNYVYFLHLNPTYLPANNSYGKNEYVSGIVFNIVKYVDANATQINRISDIAKQFNYSSPYVSRIFKEKMGITLREYVNEKKVEESFELLKSNKFSVSEIADILHFDSYRSFYKKFKNVVGISPTQYFIQHSKKAQG